MSTDEGSTIDSDTDGFSRSRSQTSLDSSTRSFQSESENFDQGDFQEEYQVDPEFKKIFDATKEEFKKAKAQSITIQTKFMGIYKQDFVTSTAADLTQRYNNALMAFEEKMAFLEKTRANFNADVLAIQEKTDIADKHRIEKEKEFQEIRATTCKNAVKQRTNKPLTQQEINEKEMKLIKIERELEDWRIQYILTKARYKKIEEELDQQDQLAEGIHLIDYEQLKIENNSLNEKKADKSQELEKFKKKIIENAHILTHVKEKLAFVRKQREALAVTQEEMERGYAEARARLATVRIRRDKVRDANSNLKKSSGLIGMNDLLYDFENRSNELELMQDKVTELKQKYSDLINMQHELEAKIAQHPPLDPTLLRMNR